MNKNAFSLENLPTYVPNMKPRGMQLYAVQMHTVGRSKILL